MFRQNRENQIHRRRFRQLCKQVHKALAADRPDEAMQILGPFLGYPARPELGDPETWQEALELFAQIAEMMGVDADLIATTKEGGDATIRPPDTQNGLAYLLRRSAMAPHEVELLHLLASAMPRVNAAGIGAMMLDRATRIAPHDGTMVAALGSTLLDTRLYLEAVRRLTQNANILRETPQARYVLVWAYLHLGQLADARAQWSLVDAPEDPHDNFTYRTVEGVLQRCDAYEQVATLTPSDLRGWNFAFNGSFLLHRSTAGVEQMNGRYSFLNDSEALCHEGIQRLAAVLDACNLAVSRVFTVAEHDSQVLATATARYLNCDLVEWPEQGSDEAGLIVIYDPAKIHPAMLHTMVTHHPGQLLWVHTISWMEDMPLGPDFITHLHEVVISPWQERAPEFEHFGEQKRGTFGELAADILNAEVADDQLADLPELCRWISALPRLPEIHAAGAMRLGGTRRHFFADSPVRSNSFRYLNRQEQDAEINEARYRVEAQKLLRKGHNLEQVEQRLSELGADRATARSVSISTYTAQQPYFHSENLLRILTCVAFLAYGIFMFVIGERYALDLSESFADRMFAWGIPIIGILTALLGGWGLLDKSAMRLRTGNPEDDLLTDEDVGKLGRFMLVALLVVVGYITIKLGFFRTVPATTQPQTIVSPLQSPLLTPNVQE